MKAKSNTDHVMRVLASESEKDEASQSEPGEEPVFLAADYVTVLEERGGNA